MECAVGEQAWYLGDRGRQMSRPCWLLHLTSLVSFIFVRDPVSKYIIKYIGGRMPKERPEVVLWPLQTCVDLYICTCTHENMPMCMHSTHIYKDTDQTHTKRDT